MTIATDTQTSTLRKLTEIADSGTWGDEGRPGEGSPVLRSSDIADNTLTFHDAAWRSIPENDRERRKLATGDIIITKSSGSPEHIGKCAIFTQPDDGRDYYFSNFMLRIRAKQGKADHRWLFYWLSSERGRDVLTAMNSTTSGLRNLSVPRYLEQEVPIPFPDDPRRSLAEQKRIAAILDKADAIRRRRQEAARLADTLIPSVFQAMFGVDPMVSGRWKPERLDALVDPDDKINYGVVQPGTDVKGGVPIVRVGDFDAGRISTKDLKRIEPEIEAQYVRSRLKGDEVLLACVGSIGLVALADEGLKGFNIVRAVARIRCGKRLNREYLASLLSTGRMQQYFKGETRTVSQPTLNIGHIESAMIPLPPIELQEQFAKQVKEIRGLHQRHTHQLRDGESLFDSLVQRAFRGEL